FCIIAWLAMLTGYAINDKRYVLPMLPYAEIYAAEALIVLLTWVRPGRRRQWLLAGCGVFAVSVSVANLRALDRSPLREGVTDPSFGEVSAFLNTQTAPGSLILSWNPRIFALYTDKRSALYPQRSRPEE